MTYDSSIKCVVSNETKLCVVTTIAQVQHVSQSVPAFMEVCSILPSFFVLALLYMKCCKCVISNEANVYRDSD